MDDRSRLQHTRILGNFPDAEDAFQAAFLVLVRKAASLRSPQLLARWLYGVVQRTASKARAAAARRCRREKQIKDMPDPHAEPDVVRNELPQLLDQVLRRLSEKYRIAVILCELEGKSRKEAARALGIPEGTLSSRLATARRMLAKRLAEHGVMVSGSAPAGELSVNSGRAGLAPTLVKSVVVAAWAIGTGKSAATAKAVALSEGMLLC